MKLPRVGLGCMSLNHTYGVSPLYASGPAAKVGTERCVELA